MNIFQLSSLVNPPAGEKIKIFVNSFQDTENCKLVEMIGLAAFKDSENFKSYFDSIESKNHEDKKKSLAKLFELKKILQSELDKVPYSIETMEDLLQAKAPCSDSLYQLAKEHIEQMKEARDTVISIKGFIEYKLKGFVDFFNHSDDLILLNCKDIVAIVAITNDKHRIKEEMRMLFASQEMLDFSHLRSKVQDYSKRIHALKNELNKIPYPLKEIENSLEGISFYRNEILYQSAQRYLQRCINTHAYIEAVSDVLLEKFSSTDMEDILFNLNEKKHCAQFFKSEAKEYFSASGSEYEFQEKDAMSKVSSINDCQDTAPLLKKERKEQGNNINRISKAKSLLRCMGRF